MKLTTILSPYILFIFGVLFIPVNSRQCGDEFASSILSVLVNGSNNPHQNFAISPLALRRAVGIINDQDETIDELYRFTPEALQAPIVADPPEDTLSEMLFLRWDDNLIISETSADVLETLNYVSSTELEFNSSLPTALNGLIREASRLFFIKDAIESGDYNSDIKVVVVSTFYFKWTHPEGRLVLNPFHLDSTRYVNTRMMRISGSFKYDTREGRTIVQIPNTETNTDLYLLKSTDNKVLLARSLKCDVRTAKESLHQSALIQMPMFDVELIHDVITEMKSRSTGSIDDLSSIFEGSDYDPDDDLTLFKHVTRFQNVPDSNVVLSPGAEIPEESNFNKPFVYLVVDRSSEDILVAGVFNKPVGKIHSSDADDTSEVLMRSLEKLMVGVDVITSAIESLADV